MRRSNTSFTVLQASMDSPTLARLVDLSAQSSACLRCIATLLPPGLRPGVQAGPIEGQVESTAMAAKLRQLQPSMLERLAHGGYDITAIRLKVRPASARPAS